MNTRFPSLLGALFFLLFSLPSWAETQEKLTILSYHEIAERNEALVPQYAVTPTNFVRQMDWLKNNGYHFVSLNDVLAYYEGRKSLPEQAVLITFDDGYRSVYLHAYPILKMLRIPAVMALVGDWMEETSKVDFDGHSIPRSKLVSWEEVREMSDSGLIEMASHTYGLHEGIPSNPQGNMQPAATARRYLPDQKRYETEANYRKRVFADLKKNSNLIKRHTGKSPRAVAWPYGRYNIALREIADKLGLKVGLTLNDGANMEDTPLWGMRRILVERTMALWDLNREIALRNQNTSDDDRPAKIMHVDLDYIYDPDPAQQEKNLGHLLDRIAAMGVNTVYLQAFADPDGNGSADSVYFPNRRLPMRADLFNRVAWQIRTRTQIKRLYAWMPMLAWELSLKDPAAKDKVVTIPSEKNGHVNMGYIRLSPFSPKAREAIREIYQDMARSTPIEGLLFHDDVTLSDYEDASTFALKMYKEWGLPESIADIHGSDDLLGRWTILKINALDAFASELADVVREEQPDIRTARNLYAQVVLNPKAEVWYSQALENSLANYDFTAIMAMPYMEKATDPMAFLHALVDKVDALPGAMDKVVFELQSIDWNEDSRLIPDKELADTIRALYGWGVQHVGYYPDNLHKDHPNPAVIKAAFDLKPSAPQPH